MSDPRSFGSVAPPASQGGPASGQFLGAFQQIGITLNSILLALQQMLGIRAAQQITLGEIAPPAPPSSGSIMYVSNVDHHTYIVGSSGTRTSIAPP